jgi:hypothetical protein
MITTYQCVRRQQSRQGYCTVCGKPVTRSKTFEQTVNPWNRNEDGTPKTPQEVYASVSAEANTWEPDDFTHTKCAARSTSTERES